MSDLYLIKKNSEENTSDNEDFRPTIFPPFQFAPEQKKPCGNQSHEKQTKHIYPSASDLLDIRIGNLKWCKCGHCKNEAREIDCLCCREIEFDAMLINAAKIPQHERSISPSSFYELLLPDHQSRELALSTQQMSSSFCSWWCY